MAAITFFHTAKCCAVTQRMKTKRLPREHATTPSIPDLTFVGCLLTELLAVSAPKYLAFAHPSSIADKRKTLQTCLAVGEPASASFCSCMARTHNDAPTDDLFANAQRLAG